MPAVIHLLFAIMVLVVGPCWANPTTNTMATDPFRKCDYCKSSDRSDEREPRFTRRAWTLFPATRKMCCPRCEPKGREEDRRAYAMIRRHYGLLANRLLAEAPAEYGSAERDTVTREQQYQRIRAKYPDVILWMREGEFYHAYGDDALTMQRALGLSVARAHCTAQPFDLVAAFHRDLLEVYLPKMVRAGYRVAVCDQIEGPPVPGMVTAQQKQLYGEEHAESVAGEPVTEYGKRSSFHPLLGPRVEPKGHHDPSRRPSRTGPQRMAAEPVAAARIVDTPAPVTYDRGAAVAGCSVLAEPVEQYRTLKRLYLDALLVLRDHSGYLMLYKDAQRAAAVLNVDYPGNGPFRIAKSRLEYVLDELVKNGHRVAVVIDPKVDDPRNAKQVDLWDAVDTEATVVQEPAAEWRVYAKDHKVPDLLARLLHDRKHLVELIAHGDTACSAYDLRNGYDARFNMRLVKNHIIWALRMLWAKYDLSQPTLF